MKAIILAAGRGSRLGNLTEDKPKCFVHANGVPLIIHQMNTLRKAGIHEIAIVRGYKKESFEFEDVKYFDNDNWQNTNMVMSLYEAKEWLSSDNCIITYSDILFEENTILNLCNIDNDIVLPYNLNWRSLWEQRFDNPLDDLESFKIDELDRITEIGKKVIDIDSVQGQYMGIIKTTPKGWLDISVLINQLDDSVKNKMDFTTLLNLLINAQIVLKGMPCNDTWYEIDNEKDLSVYHLLNPK